MKYLYRDANNFKGFGQILLTGKLIDSDLVNFESFLDSGEYFVAEQVGVPTLYSQLWKYSSGPTLADHAFHEFSLFRVATDEEVASLDLWGETSRLLDVFRMASKTSWDCCLSVHSVEF